MSRLNFLARPWWVNLLIAVPFIAFVAWRRKPPALAARQLWLAAIFAIAFGFIEAAVVVYLRAALGLLPGYGGTLADVARLSSQIYQQAYAQFPPSLLLLEAAREAATMLALLSVTLMAAAGWRERCAIFLWVFALWDISYYGWLRATVGWPASLNDGDVLFLIPVPWLAQVWFPVLVSALTILAVLAARGRAVPARLSDSL